MKGTLYLCATPIGNLGDISARCLEVLQNADLIAAEDTRRTLQLLNHFGIAKPLVSYHEHNKQEKGAYLIDRLEAGETLALVSDAGTPAVSDPGEDLVRLCIAHEIPVTSVPGAVAAVNALILSGLPTRRFSFEGFLSVQKKQRREHLEGLRYDPHTLIFYEAPHKLKTTLEDLEQAFGAERRMALARELTKVHEEVLRMTIGEAVAYYREREPRGEYVLIVEGADENQKPKEEAPWVRLSEKEHVEELIAQGLSSKDAIKEVAGLRGVPKREIYQAYHIED